MILFDRYGNAVAYSDDGENIFLFSGEPVAYFFENKVYSFTGKHLGYYSNGWIRDRYGMCIFFSDNATGGPIKPIKKIRPIKYFKKVIPIKVIRHIPFLKPIDKNSWSEYSGVRFFY